MNFKPLILLAILATFSTYAHEHPGANHTSTATYMGNEAVLITAGNSKVVFDPLFHNSFGHYQLVPQHMVDAMIAGKPPYDNIAAVFVSHAHGDHFNAEQMLSFLKAQPKTRLFAPTQAVTDIKKLSGHQSVLKQITAISLAYKGKPWRKQVDDLLIEAVRIPHAGWPEHRTEVENIVFRVTLDDKTTVMHMGDADPNDVHFKPLNDYWQMRQTNTAFPPYWFFFSEASRQILDRRINAKHSVGVHVPVKVPPALKNSGLDYFSKPGQTRQIK